MHSTTLLDRIRTDFARFTFVEDDIFRWSAESQTIHFDTLAEDAPLFILHELGHALLNHQTYVQDIDLLKLERDAWQVAVTQLADTYDVIIDETTIQNNLDTYREWLHARSQCPSCSMTGLQTVIGAYTCLACGCRWKNNEARHCALRRHTIQTQ